MTQTIHETLLHLGVPANLLGYEALTIAIELTIRDPSYMYLGITKRLYPEVAKRISYNATASSVSALCDMQLKLCTITRIRRSYVNTLATL